MDQIDNLNPVHAGYAAARLNCSVTKLTSCTGRNEPNPFFGAEKEELRGNRIENSPRLHLVDSGMANNCPQHVFLHVRVFAFVADRLSPNLHSACA